MQIFLTLYANPCIHKEAGLLLKAKCHMIYTVAFLLQTNFLKSQHLPLSESQDIEFDLSYLQLLLVYLFNSCLFVLLHCAI